MNLDGKVVAISGISSGFGVAIARRFVALGADVFGCDVRISGTDELGASRVRVAQVDLTDTAAANAWVKTIEAASGGAIDILVNNAGGVAGQASKPIDELSDEEWRLVLDINLGTTFALCRAVAPGMKAIGSGSIINISSGAALSASMTGIQAYAAAKHAVLGLTRQLAHELGPYGIRTNSVAPGLVITNEATQNQWNAYGAEKQKHILEQIALGRLGSSEEIANAVLFFASDLSVFVNGQILSVDGGK